MNESDDLNECYARSKSKYTPPSRLKRAVLNEATKAQPNHTDKMKPWGALMVAAVTGILLFNIVIFDREVRQEPVAALPDFESVEWHGYEDKLLSRFEQLQLKQEQHYQDYQHTLAVTAQHTVRLATIQQIDGEWALLDCDQNLIKISEELVAQLGQDNKLDGRFTVGDSVRLALNQDGYILNIWSSKMNTC